MMPFVRGIVLVFALAGCAHVPVPVAPAGKILWFDRNPSQGYEWSFFLYMPPGVTDDMSAVPLLVMPNNSGVVDDQPGVHRGAALKALFSHRAYAERLNAVLLMPAFPRPASKSELYTHALDRDSLLVKDGDLRRIDLQLLAMIVATQKFMNAPADAKVLLFGFSAAGMFANRFALLHPEKVLAAAVGSPGGWPMAPLSQWKSERLRYPLGSADLAELVGQPLEIESTRHVKFFFFLGSRDENDSLAFRDGYDEEDEALAMRVLGRTPVERWPVAEEMYRQVGADVEFRLYPNVGHDLTDEMDADVLAFFTKALSSNSVRPAVSSTKGAWRSRFSMR